jgi:hypothetical protein
VLPRPGFQVDEASGLHYATVKHIETTAEVDEILYNDEPPRRAARRDFYRLEPGRLAESIDDRPVTPSPTISIILVEMEPSDEKTIISAQVPVPLRDELARLARHHDLSLSDEIRRAVRLHLRVEAPGVSPSLRPVPAVRDGTSQAGQSSPSLPAGKDAA